ncbi:MAG TPA: two-component regulator propeller domain-containing protein, partial [Mucilaginibacter sp.]
LAMLQNNKIVTFKPPVPQKRNVVSYIVEDGEGTIWAIMSGYLFKVKSNALQRVTITDSASLVTSIAVNANGSLFAAVYRRGIYALGHKQWSLYTPFTGKFETLPVKQMLFDRADAQKIYVLTWEGFFYISNRQLYASDNPGLNSLKSQLLCVAQDAANNLWFGADNGAYCFCNGNLVHYNASNGLTDNMIGDICLDAGNNLWLGSLGNGFFRYDGDRYVTFDESQGMPNSKIVMAITKDWNDDIIFGADGGGLMRYNGKKLANISAASGADYLKGIQCLYTDENKTVWIGTAYHGLWLYNKRGFGKVPGSERMASNGITGDGNGVIWIATRQGCFYYENNSLKLLEGSPPFVSSLVATGRDSLFVGTQNGISLIVNKKLVNTFRQESLKNTTILCLKRFKQMMLIGTDDHGLFTWDMQSGALKNYTVADGLKANPIYSIAVDDQDKIWVGTGRGINRMQFNAAAKKFEVIDNTGGRDVILESNQNAILYKDHKIWVGTTKAVQVYDTRSKMMQAYPPHVIIQNVKLMPQMGVSTDTNYTILKNGAELGYKQNHVVISFLGVYLKNPEGVTYRYKLEGLDSAYCRPVKNNEVEYPALPPGKYSFKVRAISPDGKVSANAAYFCFRVVPPFYKTPVFQTSAVLFFVLIGFGLQNIIHQQKVLRQNAIEAIKQEEKIKIRQQTAEDFHDDLGNKLTRISILTEILNTKIGSEKADQRGLIDQIKQNAAALYTGTKDILWALDPKSDNLYETLVHIKETGIEIFQDMPVEFTFDEIDKGLEHVKLPMEYSRNITMIFKEALNNALKHADAKHVALKLTRLSKNELSLSITDDGKGFIQGQTGRGHGMHNIQARASRINAELQVSSAPGQGTQVELKFVLI